MNNKRSDPTNWSKYTVVSAPAGTIGIHLCLDKSVYKETVVGAIISVSEVIATGDPFGTIWTYVGMSGLSIDAVIDPSTKRVYSIEEDKFFETEEAWLADAKKKQVFME